MNCDILILVVLISNLAVLAVLYPREMDMILDSCIDTIRNCIQGIRKIYRKVRRG
jgi:hypothetical protein|nr:MAG TPA: hypothetical protein [Caudoviricetes sp.]